MYICHRKRVQGYLRSSLYNYLTQTTPAKSEFSKLIGIFFCHEKCLSEGGLHLRGRITIMIYYFLDSGILHFPAIAGVILADMTNWQFPCGSGGERIARRLQNRRRSGSSLKRSISCNQ